MKLFYSPGACSLSPHIVLAESGLPYKLEKVDLKTKKTETGTDYLSVNAKGYVPALEMDDGSILTEGPAIIQYLADRVPDLGLAPPAGTMDRYRLQEWLTFIGTEIHKAFSPLWHTTSDDIRKSATEALHRRFDWLAPQLADRDYLMTGRFTVADAYLFTVLNWTNFLKMPTDRWPGIGSYLKRIGSRESVIKAFKEEGLGG